MSTTAVSLARRLTATTVARKTLVAASGLFLYVYLVVHLLGNLQLYADGHGEAFDAYAEMMRGQPLLPVVELALLGVFMAHIGLALAVAASNREARESVYRTPRSEGRPRSRARWMVVSGILLAVFLVVHVLQMRFPGLLGYDVTAGLAAHLVGILSTPGGALFHAGAVLVLGLHLSHAFQSAMQTLGLSDRPGGRWLARVGLGVNLVLVAGFASFPLLALVGVGPF